MESRVAVVHYHIHWSNSKFDWQAFGTLESARTEAERLVVPDETFTLDQFDDDCPHCEATAARLRARMPSTFRTATRRFSFYFG